MLGTFSAVAPYIKFNPKKVSIDNLAFKLHYRWTFAILIIATILVTSRTYIGDHIKCISGTIKQEVIETFCFFTTTFTVVKHMNETSLKKGSIAHAGVGHHVENEDEVKHHAYYQWVPFVLFAQALMFYLPHLLWKSWEKKRIYNLVNGLRMIGISRHLEKSMKIAGRDIPSSIETNSKIKDIKDAFKNRLICNEFWGAKLILCELLNLANIILQIYITNTFLGGQFLRLGIWFWNEDWQGPMDSLDIVFPKVTKCVFHKYGPSGSIQNHDTLCVMALNIINEKIYVFLWFWFLFVFIASILAIVWRFVSLFIYKSLNFNQFIFKYTSPSAGRIDPRTINLLMKRCNFGNWMFLYFLATNMSGFYFRKVLDMIALDFDSRPPTIDETVDNEANKQIMQEEIKYRPIDEVDIALITKEKTK